MVCLDVADAFVSVQLCLSGSQCSYGLQALAPAFGSISGVCQATVAQYAAAATAGGRLDVKMKPGAKLRTGWFWGRVIVCSF